MKIHYFSSETWEEAVVRSRMPDADITFHHGPFSDHTDFSDPDAEVLCVFVEARIGEKEMGRFPSLKLIATRSTGFDHIDLAAAKARNIAVANVPFYGENTVAEFAFALILALSRRVIDADESVRAGVFSPNGLRGFDLSGKTLGVVGCGHIGLHVIKIANGFGMKVLGLEIHPDAERAKENNFTYATMPELLASSDIISIHVPYNKNTHHLINKDNINTIKKGAYLVNTSRGAIVDTEALVLALRDGILAGAALDVLEEEGELADEMNLLSTAHPSEDSLKILLADHYLINHPRVIVTPHCAFNTQEAVERIVATTIENIRSFANGTPTNIVS